MAEVLCVYREVKLLKKQTKPVDAVAIVSYDEKPGVQAIGVTAPDLPPVPGIRPTVARLVAKRVNGTWRSESAMSKLQAEAGRCSAQSQRLKPTSRR